MSDTTLELMVARYAEQIVMEGIFAEFVADQRMDIEAQMTSSGAIVAADAVLLLDRQRPVVVALSVDGRAEEERTSIRNILARSGSPRRWHVALAVPDMTVWTLKEPSFAAAVDQAVKAGDLPPEPSEPDLAVYFKQWAESGHRFDRATVAKADPEFAALNEFIERHVAAQSQSATQSTTA